jgi:hypothetical protein
MYQKRGKYTILPLPKLLNGHKIYHMAVIHICIPNGRNTYIPNGRNTYIPNGRNTYIPKGRNAYIPNGRNTLVPKRHRIYNFFHSQAFQNLPKL